jgi:hypothetical protein
MRLSRAGQLENTLKEIVSKDPKKKKNDTSDTKYWQRYRSFLTPKKEIPEDEDCYDSEPPSDDEYGF